MSEFVWNFSMLSTTKDSNESRNSLARGSILNFLNSFLQDTLILTPAIVLMIFFWMINTVLQSVEFPQKITPYHMME
jgi:uncharacterized membrane protein